MKRSRTQHVKRAVAPPLYLAFRPLASIFKALMAYAILATTAACTTVYPDGTVITILNGDEVTVAMDTKGEKVSFVRIEPNNAPHRAEAASNLANLLMPALLAVAGVSAAK